MANQNNDKGRRAFLRNLGILSAAGVLASCGADTKQTGSETTKKGTGEMTMRRNHNTGDNVSILGYGCMRFPTIGMRDGTDNDTLDQEAVNRLIDHALEHGVNY
ncbi:MAG: aldo/keto reductase, partial [Muribaculaceae bacterium]|nr:aldo/keto reductase [Muribaculaceae bacterium]